jgi:hypothetical protein
MLRMAALVTAVIAVSALPLTSATAAKLPTVSDATRYCAAPPPVSRQVGNWTCYANSKTARDPRLSGAIPAATTDYCNAEGCWYRYSNTSAQFAQTGLYYFYGTTQLGEMFMNITWTLSGTKESETATVDVNHAVIFPQWDGVLLNGARNVVGSDIALCPSRSGPANVAANVSQHPPSGWCAISDNKNYDHNMNLQYSWQAPNTSGYWYSWGNSVVNHSPTLPATSYTFDPVNYLPGDPASAGWSA